jgi:hypothetical protein
MSFAQPSTADIYLTNAECYRRRLLAGWSLPPRSECRELLAQALREFVPAATILVALAILGADLASTTPQNRRSTNT